MLSRMKPVINMAIYNPIHFVVGGSSVWVVGFVMDDFFKYSTDRVLL